MINIIAGIVLWPPRLPWYFGHWQASEIDPMYWALLKYFKQEGVVVVVKEIPAPHEQNEKSMQNPPSILAREPGLRVLWGYSP